MGEVAHAYAVENDTCACGAVHTHTYAETLTKGETAHWYAATCNVNANCANAKKDESAHVYPADTNTCVCGAIHTHTYDEKYQYIDEAHWLVATCNANSSCKNLIEAHEFSDEGACVCGYLRPGSQLSPIAVELPNNLSLTFADYEIIYYVFTLTEDKTIKVTLTGENSAIAIGNSVDDALNGLDEEAAIQELEIFLSAGTYYVAFGTADCKADSYDVDFEFVDKESLGESIFTLFELERLL
jgi:hypothetical protein